jgi:hypothetical protein
VLALGAASIGALLACAFVASIGLAVHRGVAWIRAAINIGVADMNEIAFYELGAAGARLGPKQLALAQQVANQLPVSRSARPSLGSSATDGANKLAWRQ